MYTSPNKNKKKIIYNNCIVTGANSTEAHYVEIIPVTEEQPYDTI